MVATRLTNFGRRHAIHLRHKPYAYVGRNSVIKFGLPQLQFSRSSSSASSSDMTPAQVIDNLKTTLGDYPESHKRLASILSADEIKKLDAVCHEYIDQPVEPPTRDQLVMTFWAGVIPFLGFGFLDNALMIMFGDVIDQSFCVVFGFSTLAVTIFSFFTSLVTSCFSVKSLFFDTSMKVSKSNSEGKNIAA